MKEFMEEVEKSVLKLSRTKRILFSVINSERLLDCYVAFQRINGWGDHLVLRNSMDMVYEYLIDNKVYSLADFRRQLEVIDNITPHMDDFSGVIASFALNACTSVENTLDYIISGDVKYVMEMVTAAYDTVDMFVQEKENLNSRDIDLEKKIWNDIFLQNELKHQRAFLNQLATLQSDNVTDNIIENLRNKNKIIDLTLI